MHTLLNKTEGWVSESRRSASGNKKLAKKKSGFFFCLPLIGSIDILVPISRLTMGKVRPNNLSEKKPNPKEANAQRGRSESPSEPIKKKAKVTEVVENEPHLAPPTKSGLDALLHPLPFSTFVKRYWEPACPLLIKRPYDSLWNAKLVPQASSKSRLTSTLSAASKPAYYHTDVQLLGYSAEDDDLIFETPPGGAVDMRLVWGTILSKSTSKPSLHVSNFDLFSTELSKLLSDVDSRWRGDGAAVAKLTVAAPGSIPFGIHLDGQSQFIMQIVGTQRIQVLEHPDGPQSFVETAGEESSFPCFVHGPAPEVVLSAEHANEYTASGSVVTLEAGSTLFLPSCVKLADAPASSDELSIWLTVYLPPMPHWKPTLEEIIMLASAASVDIAQDASSLDRQGVTTLSTEDPNVMDEPTNDAVEGDEDEGENGEEDEEDEEAEEDDDLEEEAEEEVGENEAWTLFPHKLDVDGPVENPGERLKTNVVEILERAAKIAPQYIDSLLRNSCYSRTDFLDTVPSMQAKLGEQGLEAMLKANGGLVKISNFLSDHTAECIHKLISQLPETDWAEAYASDDASANNINHAFRSSRTFPAHHAVLGLFKRVLPQYFGDFSLGRYSESHFIAPHDDRAYKEVNGEHFSRHIALIYYCSKDWKDEYGGQLVDMVTGKEYVPEFNSMIAFEVPRFHQVNPVLAPLLARYSIFGWFFKPGINYELWTGEEDQEDDEDDEE